MILALFWEASVLSVGAQAHAPKSLFGSVTNSDGTVPQPTDLQFVASISSFWPAQRLSNLAPGWFTEMYEGTCWYNVECSAFVNQWRVGDLLVIEMTNTAKGDYVTNQVLLDSQPFQQFDLRLEARASLRMQPANATGLVESNATFLVEAAGTPPVGFFWRKDGASLPEDSKYQGVNTSALRVLSLTPADGGAYTVLVSNRLGTVLSSNALLTVLTTAPCLAARWHPATGQLHLDVAGEQGQAVEVLASSNLTTWQPLLTLTNLPGSLTLTNGPRGVSRQFYRARHRP